MPSAKCQVPNAKCCPLTANSRLLLLAFSAILGAVNSCTHYDNKTPASFDRKFIPLTTRFDHALLFASQVHRHQDRKKSGIPYLSHLLGVASIVLDYGGDEEMAIGALLHDAVEDHGGRPMLKVIDQIFGPRVAKIVDGCTDSYATDPKKKKVGSACKFRYLHRVRHGDAETRFVSAADKLYNVRAVLRDACGMTGRARSPVSRRPRQRRCGTTARW